MNSLKQEFVRLNQKDRLYKLPVPVIGLTGGVASGKTTVSYILRDRGLTVVCADTIVKKVYHKESSLEYVRKNFPNAYQDREILFPVLRKMVFNDPKIRKQLEDFIHPQMEEVFLDEVRDKLDNGAILYNTPLLFEKKINLLTDISICVYCDSETQIERIIKRDSIDQELAKKMLASQIDIEEKREKSDFVIDNSKNHQHLLEEISSKCETLFKD